MRCTAGFAARTGSRTQFEVFAALRNFGTNMRGLRVRGENANQTVCTIRAELRKSSVRNFPKKRGGLIIVVARHCEFNRNPGLRNCSRFEFPRTNRTQDGFIQQGTSGALRH